MFRLEGKDGFDPDADYYPISEHDSLREALAFAQQRLVQLAAEQPDAGGQAGIQDRVYIVHPDGQRQRIMPAPPAEEEEPVLLACIPEHDEKNLAWAREVGLGDNPPWLQPYEGSKPGWCEFCEGKLWIGPTQQQKLAELDAAHKPRRVLCLVCGMLLVAAGGTELLSLRPGARTGFVPGTYSPQDEFEVEWELREAEEGE